MSITHRYVPTCAGRECSFRLNQIQLCRQRTRVTSGASIHTSAWGQTVEWQSRELAVPLSQLEPLDADADTREIIGDWHYWLARGHEF